MWKNFELITKESKIYSAWKVRIIKHLNIVMRQNVKAIEKFWKTQTLGLGIYILIYDLCDKIVIALIVMMLFLAPTFLFYLAWAPGCRRHPWGWSCGSYVVGTMGNGGALALEESIDFVCLLLKEGKGWDDGWLSRINGTIDDEVLTVRCSFWLQSSSVSWLETRNAWAFEELFELVELLFLSPIFG